MDERLSCVSSRVTKSNGGPVYLVINMNKIFDKKASIPCRSRETFVQNFNNDREICKAV